MIHWGDYLEKIESKGNQNMLAILKMDSPKINNEFNIELENKNINQVKLKIILELSNSLRNKLNNHKIYFNININISNDKTFIYTAEEKYEKMKLINPAINILRKTFDLDV